MPTPWYETWHGLLVITVYGLLTVGAALVSMGWLVDPSTFFVVGSTGSQVPGFVYVFAFLGAMAYAFTSVVAKFERGTPGVLRVGIRAMAALPLAAGVFLLADGLQLGGTGSQFLAGVAFLVGLYVNVTLKALGGLADRLFGRTTGSGSSTGQADGASPESPPDPSSGSGE